MSRVRHSLSNGTAQIVTCWGMRSLNAYDLAPLI